METDYDRKFEEMKKYIPFLENMICRLESAGSGSGNPRLAQLAKIRSLRDLLLDKRKRMKMENLMKCEQVLVNLYAKIEQRDSFLESSDIGSHNPQLDLVRSKLKKVTARLQDSDTLPEIVGPSRSEEVTPGSKEPALFQIRQNNTLSPARSALTDSDKSSSSLHKKNYTRVLISPDPETKPRPIDTSRRKSPIRTPKKSPRKTTFLQSKSDRKKSSSQDEQTTQLKDLNITLKVPEESLNSLNTKDILSRIINCSDNDVDIDTLRGLRTQILSELKQTGAKDDISDLILESYKRKKKSGSKKKQKEFEEGELSDSESEVIESIYGSLVVVDKDQDETSNKPKAEEKDDLPRKIQICLVINSEKESQDETITTNDLSKKNTVIDISDFEPYRSDETYMKTIETESENKETTIQHRAISENISSIPEKNEKDGGVHEKADKALDISNNSNDSNEKFKNTNISNINRHKISEVLPNNLKPKSTKGCLNKDSSSKIPQAIPNKSSTIALNKTTNETVPTENKSHDNLTKLQDSIEIPLLDLETNAKQKVVQEIDILQALKKEILSEKISLSDCETNTPPLHQPKVMKVANIEKILPKKRISIEKYKEKSTSAPQATQLTSEIYNNTSKDELLKKQSLKLTEKEYERFNLSTNMSLAETSDEEDNGKRSPSTEDMYSALAPKSPDHEDFADTGIKPPIIIPAEPVKAEVAPSISDVDMRMMPLKPLSKLLTDNKLLEKPLEGSKKETEPNTIEKALPLVDPRVRRDFGNINVESAHISSADNVSRTQSNFSPNMTPTRMPKTTINRMSGITQTKVIPNMGYEMTPSRQSFDSDNSKKDHVYAPIFPVVEPNNVSVIDGQNAGSFSRLRDDSRSNLCHSNSEIQSSFYVENSFVPLECPPTPNHSFGRLDMPITPIHAFGRTDGPMTPAHPFGRSDCSPTPSYTFGRTDCPSTPSYLFPRTDGPSTPSHPYGRIDCPSTPSHPFGRTDCPSTPNHPFGRTDCPPTPNHPFGRSDCPPTPNHSFGRSDCPPTPNHSFGRSDCPPTPNHSFGRSDCPPTPSQPFGRSDCSAATSRPFGRKEHLMTPNNPFGRGDFSQNQTIIQNTGARCNKFQNARNNRYSEGDNLPYCNDDMDGGKYTEHNFNTRNYKYEESKRNYTDSYRNYDRHVSRRETSIGRSSYKNYKYDQRYSNDRSTAYGVGDYRNETDIGKFYNDSGTKRNNRREHSVGRNLSDDKYTKCHKEKDYTTGNTLSVQSNAGRSFTIDTSVNRSFQDTISKFKNVTKICTDFDARRKRASSVGRHLGREPSAERSSLNTAKKTNSPDLKTNFRRARSVGREPSECHSKKRFEDIKVELQSYKHAQTKNNESSHFSNQDFATNIRKKLNDRDPRLSRRDRQSLETCKKEDQSTKLSIRRGDIRDPRLQRGLNKDTQNKLHVGKSIEDRKKQGIVYSNDNIVKGTILGSGYGVKNYKIPKIKRAQEETCSKDTIDDVKVETVKTDKKCGIEKQNDKDETNSFKPVEDKDRSEEEPISVGYEKVLEKSENNDDVHDKNRSVVENVSGYVEKRVTRSSTKISVNEKLNELNSDNKPVSRKKRNRILKPLRYDSDSDDDTVLIIDSQTSNECSVQTSIEKDSATLKDKITCSDWDGIKTTENLRNSKDCAVDGNFVESEGTKLSENLISAEDLSNYMPDSDNCFGMDLEMFPDSLATDPVIENINELIADLDDDLETSKNDGNKRQFTKEIILENMLENITCSEKKACGHSDNDNEKRTEANEPNIKINEDSIPNIETNNKQEVDSNSGVVSTTETEIKYTLPQKKLSKCYDDDDDICSTPDSTINVNENVHETACQEKLPDSSGELPCEMSSDITSTEVKVTSQLNSSHSDTNKQSDSIGSLLSILKDKSKIQELLSMIKEQSNGNEKLKKKLEMLSEIVSDDEDLSNSSKSLASTTEKNNESAIVEATVSSNDTISDKHCDEDIKDKTQEISTDAVLHRSVEIDSTIETDQAPGPPSITSDSENKDQDEKVKENVVSEDNSEALQEKIDNDKIKDMTVESELSNNNENAEAEITKPTKKMKGKMKNSKVNAQKPPTRSSAALKIDKPLNIKKPSRELKQLQNDIKEMFLNEDVLNTSGIRMCRLAKLVEDKSSPEKGDQNVDNSPVVILQKIKQSFEEATSKGKACKKKQSLKTKAPLKQTPMNIDKNAEITTESKLSIKHKPGPKSKNKVSERTDVDPYMFESDSIAESNDTNNSEKQVGSGSESESGSLASSQSFGSNEQLVEMKKKVKRRRRGWQSGVIKSKNKKRKMELNRSEIGNTSEFLTESCLNITDDTCFTDKTYCFSKNVTNYSCRLCSYTGNDIVYHHKKRHPHSEIPLSRMSPDMAKEAIEQSEEFNFQTLSKLPFDKHVCRFCFEEFSKRKTVLESFFWHVVSTHTGEYKQICSECRNEKQCPFNLDIPAPPKEPKGQLIGYICGKCNFTQISLENLKTHVINRHNDEETEVYTINLGIMSKKTLSLLTKTTTTTESKPRILRSSRGTQNTAEVSDEPKQYIGMADTQSETYIEKFDIQSDAKLDTTHTKRKQMKSQIYFENEDVTKEICELSKVSNIKVELEQDSDTEHVMQHSQSLDVASDTLGQEPLADETDTREQEPLASETVRNEQPVEETDSDEHGQLMDDVDTDERGQLMIEADASSAASNDVLDYPHFKVSYTLSGTKEYVCCINGTENHYRTALLISFKKHVQLKHSEIWDGFCFLCKLIVTPQGKHFFKDCLQHFLDKHIDNFPIIENEENSSNNIDTNIVPHVVNLKEQNPNKNHLNVRPLSELIGPAETPPATTLPVIESVVSLGTTAPGATHTSIADLFQLKIKQNVYKYEETQTEVMDKKNKVVLEVMMDREKLVHIFKCAGRFCSYSTDEPGDALRHAITHERAGGQRALDCIYCDFDSSQSAVDLVTHVFKAHGGCRFACGHCFYRAAAAQLVRAHALRLHPALGPHAAVLRSTAAPRAPTAPTDQPTAADILPREIAVPYYVCVQPGGCRFRTYTSGKFCEHLQLRHSLDASFLCSVCSLGVSKAAELIQHMKVHGYKFYQCTWCVHGADDEAGLLAHAARAHPARPPQAYLRVITNKEGNAGFRVLPLAQLNISKIATIDVIPSTAKKDPAREAERSIDLEKLIGQTTEMIESQESPAEPPATSAPSEPVAPPAPPAPGDDYIEMSEPQFSNDLLTESKSASLMNLQSSVNNQIADAAFVAPESAQLELSAPAPDPAPPTSPQAPPPAPAPAPAPRSGNDTTSEIICLDSDEDNCDDALDVSANETDTTKLVERSQLFKCGVCPAATLKTALIFKRHILGVHAGREEFPCAHCPALLPKAALLDHYRALHCARRDTPCVCALCDKRFATLGLVRKHLQAVHGVAKQFVTSNVISDGKCQLVVGETPKKKPSKRTLSDDAETGSAQPPAKMTRFGPADVHRLPIQPILDELVFCAVCEYSTKVRLNMARHLQLHAACRPAPNTAPVNPVPHLETNEKHFDKMVNLASSSLAAPRPERPTRAAPASPLAPDRAALYPRYVPDRQRYTCGAPDCCYISLSEDMLKHHWEALHSTAADFSCVHCPPAHRLHAAKQLTAARVVSHMRMHDAKLYACPLCPYFHYRRQAVDKHLADRHAGAGAALVVREDPPVPAPPPAASAAPTAPTMDLKPWQCGLCEFRSMLRQEVVDHCADLHGCKMQYKCFHCAFRTSTLENETKHRAKFHPESGDETFYVYYREGAVPDQPDGTPRWRHQRLRLALPHARIKTEAEDGADPRSSPAPAAPSAPPAPAAPPVPPAHFSPAAPPAPSSPAAPPAPSSPAAPPAPSSPAAPAAPQAPAVDLNIVKREPESDGGEGEGEGEARELYERFGRPCEPAGLRYKCPLCSDVTDECRDRMQSHLYEELQCRKWGCVFCSYKAFHKAGLADHMATEHRRARDAIELPVDPRIEMWIAKILDYQFLAIEKNRIDASKGASVRPSDPAAPAPVPGSAPSAAVTAQAADDVNDYNIEDLVKSFGKFGAPENGNFCCPKCGAIMKEEKAMREHLEIELNKIRWSCSACPDKFQNYHEAQFHCRTAHAQPGALPAPGARALEAPRNAAMRAAWLAAAVAAQASSLGPAPAPRPPARDPPPDDNSLLEVRYEEHVAPPPDLRAPPPLPPHTAPPPLPRDSDSDDDDKLVIDEPAPPSPPPPPPPPTAHVCPFCGDVLPGLKEFKVHVSRHDDIKPYFCAHCDYNGHRKSVLKHLHDRHENSPARMVTRNQRAVGPPLAADSRLLCLRCEKPLTGEEARLHTHDGAASPLAKEGEIVVKCCACLTLHRNIGALTVHHEATHPEAAPNYVYHKVLHTKKNLFCVHCMRQFKYMHHLRAHTEAAHGDFAPNLGTRKRPLAAVASAAEPPARRCARKSTTKLPSQAVAKKSTAKLSSHNGPQESETEEYSFYGTRPRLQGLAAVTTRLRLGTAEVAVSLRQLREVMSVSPVVRVRDIAHPGPGPSPGPGPGPSPGPGPEPSVEPGPAPDPTQP